MRALIGEASILSPHACERKRPPIRGELLNKLAVVIAKVDYSAASGWAAKLLSFA